MNRTDRNRLQRLEAKAGGIRCPRVVIIPTGLDGGPEHATCSGFDCLKPEENETLHDFEQRAEQHFEADQVLTIVFGGGADAI